MDNNCQSLNFKIQMFDVIFFQEIFLFVNERKVYDNNYVGIYISREFLK